MIKVTYEPNTLASTALGSIPEFKVMMRSVLLLINCTNNSYSYLQSINALSKPKLNKIFELA